MARLPINRRQRLLQVMDRYWGYGALRPLQREATQSVLAGRDSVVVLPAGGGKSLCFQAPALCLCGVTVVVSPLNSLVWDQVDVLRKSGIRAACVNSAVPVYRQREVVAQLCGGELKLLYISPERLITEPMLDLLETQDVAMFAIEQAQRNVLLELSDGFFAMNLLALFVIGSSVAAALWLKKQLQRQAGVSA